MSVAALRAKQLPKAPGWLGVAIAMASVLLVALVLAGLEYGFGLLLIVWFGWLGIAMLRSTSRPAAPATQS